MLSLITTSSVVGCLSGPEGDETDPGETTSESTPSKTPAKTDIETCNDEGGAGSGGFGVGETSGDVAPHGLTVRNDIDDRKVVKLEIVEAETAELLLERACTLEPGAEMSGDLRGPAEFEVQVSLPHSGATHVTTVDYFDTCNDYGTTVLISSGGTISSETIKTDAECDPDTPPE